MTKVAVVISGCGSLDGAEIFETVFTLLELDKNNADVKIFAPNKNQHYVINHLTQEKMPEERNILIESARIARGKIQSLSKLYVKDFDNNGSVEQVMAYTLNGEEFTFLCKDELERSLPILKKAYLTYGEVAGKSVQYLFYDLFKNYRELSAETLSSSCFINDGKGNFVRKSLPADLQLSPVFTFTSMSTTSTPSFLGAGNFYGVIPYEGRYDALAPTAFSWNQSGNAFNTFGSLPLPDGEIRDAKWINRAGGKRVLVLSVNNQGLLFYQ